MAWCACARAWQLRDPRGLSELAACAPRTHCRAPVQFDDTRHHGRLCADQELKTDKHTYRRKYGCAGQKQHPTFGCTRLTASCPDHSLSLLITPHSLRSHRCSKVKATGALGWRFHKYVEVSADGSDIEFGQVVYHVVGKGNEPAPKARAPPPLSSSLLRSFIVSCNFPTHVSGSYLCRALMLCVDLASPVHSAHGPRLQPCVVILRLCCRKRAATTWLWRPGLT